MKTAQMTGRDGRSGIGRKIDIFRDPHWVAPVPIFSFLIEHPEGRFLVDTGDTWRNSVPGYLPWWNPFFTKQVQNQGGTVRGDRMALAFDEHRSCARHRSRHPYTLPSRPHRRPRPFSAQSHHCSTRELRSFKGFERQIDGLPAAALADLVQARPDYSKYAVGWAVFIDIPDHAIAKRSRLTTHLERNSI